MQDRSDTSYEDLTLAREVTLGVWTERYNELRAATDLEATIMDEANDLANFAMNADTRTTTILLVSFLEDTLEKTFIEQWDLSSRKEKGRIFGASGPLSTFSQRTTVARGIKWLTREQVAEFDLLRRIRNIFAHNHRIHALNNTNVSQLVLALPNHEQIWCEQARYQAAYDGSDTETRYRLRVFCAGMFNISSILVNAKTLRAQIPLGFRPASGWAGMMEVEQAMVDVAIRFCWLSLGLGFTGKGYKYRRDRVAVPPLAENESAKK